MSYRSSKALPPTDADQAFVTILADHLVGTDIPKPPPPEEPLNSEEALVANPLGSRNWRNKSCAEVVLSHLGSPQ